VSWTDADLAAHYERLKVPHPDAPPAPAKISEAVIEAECTRILECDGWRALRTDPVSDRSRGKGFGEIGMADHLMIRYRPPTDWQAGMPGLAEVIWIEYKRPGEKPRKNQTAWHIRERARGALTLIAGEDFPATVEGFRNWYAGSGLMRRTA
jgi:hypothetical protein